MTTTLHDAAGRQVVTVNPLGLRTTTSWDAADRPLRTTDPNGRVVTSAFDAAGRQTLRLDPRGIRTTWVHDAAGRQTGVRYPDGTRVTTVYNAVGKRLLVHDSVGRYTRTWDPIDRIRVSTNAFGGTLTFTWDAAGQRKSLVDPLGGITTYAYDTAGRLGVLTDPEAGRTTYAYDAAGRRTLKRLANGTRASFTYDAAGQLGAVCDLTSGGSVVSSFDYAYDAAGNRSRVVDASGDRTTWTYDAANQLTAERRSGPSAYAHTFAYDQAGNRTVLNEDGTRSTFTYDLANRLRVRDAFGSGRTTYTYDTAGNQRTVESPTGDVTTNTWSFENQNVQVELPSAELVTLIYNGDKQQVAREDADGQRRFHWDKHNLVLEADDANAPLVRAQFEPDEYGRLISRRDVPAGETTWHHFDALGSTAALTDASQVVGQEYAYRAWGDEPAPTADENPYRWVGELGYRYDEATGRHNLRRRDYESQIARFLSEDPPEGDDDPNRYRYVRNRPTDETDPSGLGDLTVQRVDTSDGNLENLFVVSRKNPRERNFAGLLHLKDGRGDTVSRRLLNGETRSVPYKVLLDDVFSSPPRVSATWASAEWDQWFCEKTGGCANKPEAVTPFQAFKQGELHDPEDFICKLRAADKSLNKLNLPSLPIGSLISAMARKYSPEIFDCEEKGKRCRPPDRTEQFIEGVGDIVPQIQQALGLAQLLELPPDKISSELAKMLPGMALDVGLEGFIAIARERLEKLQKEADLFGDKEPLNREVWNEEVFNHQLAIRIAEFLRDFDPKTCQPKVVDDFVRDLRKMLEGERKRVEKVRKDTAAELARLAALQGPLSPVQEERKKELQSLLALVDPRLQNVQKALQALGLFAQNKDTAILVYLLTLFAIGVATVASGDEENEDSENKLDDVAEPTVKFTKQMLSNSEVIARGTEIQKINELVAKFGGQKKRWIKKKGWDSCGNEWHWYEHHGIGRVGVKRAGEPDPF